jgi:hypothetical protein
MTIEAIKPGPNQKKKTVLLIEEEELHLLTNQNTQN